MTDRIKIIKLIEKELEEANEKHPLFQSPHEAWAVLKEEVEELADDTTELKARIKAMWSDVRSDRDIEPQSRLMYNAAINAACEAIQTAAMCKKIEQSKLY